MLSNKIKKVIFRKELLHKMLLHGSIILVLPLFSLRPKLLILKGNNNNNNNTVNAENGYGFIRQPDFICNINNILWNKCPFWHLSNCYLIKPIFYYYFICNTGSQKKEKTKTKKTLQKIMKENFQMRLYYRSQ